ncbi:surface-adhesin E family protein [Variovorax sp. VNK109]|uniref:surface-adhesin E family protein n=1 Tax=Variovorax sp. VNK109 TaxID=3400919 RepID=UPI003C0C9147
MRWWVAVVSAVLFCGAASAEPTWLVIVGNPEDPIADTVLVDAASIRTEADGSRQLVIRVNRASTRRSPITGQVFRSYSAEVEIDCRTKVGLFKRVDYFDGPLWKGHSFSSDVSQINPRSHLAFRGMQPNPAPRIIRAACTTRTEGRP